MSLLLVFGFFHRRERRNDQEWAAAPPDSLEALNKVKEVSSHVSSTDSVQNGAAIAPSIGIPGQGKTEQVQEALSIYNDQPIVFYGRLLDQFSQPVPNATVDFTVRVINGSKSTTDRGRTVSDIAGLFSISGYTGQDLSVNPSKPGYVLSSISGLFNYSHLFPDSERIHPDPKNPTVIQMWRLQGAEKLISFDIEDYVPCNGSPVLFDLQTGRRVPNGGDILIAVESTNAPSLKDGYNWQAHIGAVQGGVARAFNVRPEQMLGAPDSGYSNVFDIDYDYDVKPWTARFRGAFYFVSRERRCYGRFSMEILSDVVKDNKVCVRISGVLNPSGSRDLEVDPQLVTQAHP